jgi:EAL domain-containing protein (putative c-di-GMP-specific phosphodiesterase class I)/CheY-like chemotaxis protein
MKRSVCILDDEAHVAATIARMVTASGFSAREFTTAGPFLAEVKNSKPDLVILDLALGRVDAIDIMRHLARVAYKGYVVLISGHANDVLSDAKAIGARHGLRMLPTLKKPFKVHHLNAALKAINRPRLVNQSTPGPPVAPKEALKIDFKEALGNRWLEVWYQPKVDLRSLMVCGAEALVRMRHPVHGILPPAHFLPRPGDPMHKRLARAVLKRAMVDWYGFAEARLALKLAVNVPISVIGTAEFLSFVRSVLPRDNRFPGLILEMIEDEVVGNAAAVREVAMQLRLNKVTLSTGDFGSSNASLARLAEIPFDELKLDGRFARGCAADKAKRSLCRSIINLGHEFGATVCAEGVEDTVDLRTLIDLRCDMAQGFLFAAPMPADQLAHFLRYSPGRAPRAEIAAHSASRPLDQSSMPGARMTR